MSLRKDKAKVLGERFSDERIKSFMDVEPVPGEDADYLALERAYRGMVAEDFEKFVRFFAEAGRNFDARNSRGETFREVISRHRHAEPYLAALDSAR